MSGKLKLSRIEYAWIRSATGKPMCVQTGALKWFFRGAEIDPNTIAVRIASVRKAKSKGK